MNEVSEDYKAGYLAGYAAAAAGEPNVLEIKKEGKKSTVLESKEAEDSASARDMLFPALGDM